MSLSRSASRERKNRKSVSPEISGTNDSTKNNSAKSTSLGRAASKKKRQSLAAVSGLVNTIKETSKRYSLGGSQKASRKKGEYGIQNLHEEVINLLLSKLIDGVDLKDENKQKSIPVYNKILAYLKIIIYLNLEAYYEAQMENKWVELENQEHESESRETKEQQKQESESTETKERQKELKLKEHINDASHIIGLKIKAVHCRQLAVDLSGRYNELLNQPISALDKKLLEWEDAGNMIDGQKEAEIIILRTWQEERDRFISNNIVNLNEDSNYVKSEPFEYLQRILVKRMSAVANQQEDGYKGKFNNLRKFHKSLRLSLSKPEEIEQNQPKNKPNELTLEMREDSYIAKKKNEASKNTALKMDRVVNFTYELIHSSGDYSELLIPGENFSLIMKNVLCQALIELYQSDNNLFRNLFDDIYQLSLPLEEVDAPINQICKTVIDAFLDTDNINAVDLVNELKSAIEFALKIIEEELFLQDAESTKNKSAEKKRDPEKTSSSKKSSNPQSGKHRDAVERPNGFGRNNHLAEEEREEKEEKEVKKEKKEKRKKKNDHQNMNVSSASQPAVSRKQKLAAPFFFFKRKIANPPNSAGAAAGEENKKRSESKKHAS